MDLKEIKRVISLVEEANISSLMVEVDGLKIEVKKEFQGQVTHYAPNPQSFQPVSPREEFKSTSPTEKPAPDTKTTPIKSPMVGTFYFSSNPESPPYVKVGDRVQKGQVVCIIEAMKLFNEIESDVTGTVEKIVVENAAPVEYGQPLFLINPE